MGLRKFAVSFLRSVVRSQPGSSHWMIGMIVAQLTHHDASLRAATLSLLQEMAIDPSYLMLLIKKKPQLSHCGLLAQPLQCLFLSSKAGLEYVGGGSGVVALMRQWKSEGCVRYVESLERCLVVRIKWRRRQRQREQREAEAAVVKVVKVEQRRKWAGSGSSKPAAAKAGAAERKARQQPASRQRAGCDQCANRPLSPPHPHPLTSPTLPTSRRQQQSLLFTQPLLHHRPPLPHHNRPPPLLPLPWFFFAPTPRTSLDDYFLSRLHALPWSVELTADWPNGRTNVSHAD